MQKEKGPIYRGEDKDVRLSALRPSPTNPRTVYEDIDGLAASIAANGLMTRLWTRESPDGTHEVVAGERRRRALEQLYEGEDPLVRVTVGAPTDEEVLAMQLVENEQRKSVGDLEAADAYAALRDTHGLSVAEIGARVGQSEATVYRRLALAGLCPAARKLVADGTIGLGVARELAKLPDPKVQAAATKALVRQHWHTTVDSARRFLERDFMLRLSAAQWPLDDETLVKAAGACSSCPKRSSAQAYLFAGEDRGEDRCLDAKCWDKKKSALWRRTKAEAKKRGLAVLTEEQSREIYGPYGGQPKGFLELGQRPSYETSKTTAEVLGKRVDDVERTLAKNPHTGEIVELVKPADVKRVLREEPRKSDPPSLAGKKRELSALEKAERARRRREKLVRQAKDQAFEASVAELRDGVANGTLAGAQVGQAGLDQALRWLVQDALQGLQLQGDELRAVAEARGLPVQLDTFGGAQCEALPAWVRSTTDRAQLVALALEIVVRSNPLAEPGPEGERSLGAELLDHLGVDWLANEKAALAALEEEKANAKAAKSKAAKKSTTKKRPKRKAPEAAS
ncbi:MAG: ParB/RepB/Spo0J family partition protein [Sandaracinaceae bacterium]